MVDLKASIIVAVYNGEKTLEYTIESILAQTRDNFELLLIDDGSTDGSAQLISKYLTHPNVKYFKKENGGVASARNFGIKVSTGALIGFCDQDDQWKPEKLEKQVPLFERESVGLVYSWVDVDDHGERTLSQPTAEGYCFDALLDKNFISCCTVLARKSVLEAVNGFDESRELHGVDDRHVWLKIAKVSDVAVVKQSLAIYFIHGENYSLNNQKMLVADLSCIRKVSSLPDLTNNERALCRKATFNAFMHYANNMFYRNDSVGASECLFNAWKLKPLYIHLLASSLLLRVLSNNALVKLKAIKNRIR